MHKNDITAHFTLIFFYRDDDPDADDGALNEYRDKVRYKITISDKDH